jgi:peptide/nickel transport system permease protein
MRPNAQAASEASTAKPPEQQHLARLHQILNTRFNKGELLVLCLNLGMDYNAVPGEGKVDKTRELVASLERHNRISELVRIGEQLRPDIPWTAPPRVQPERLPRMGGIRGLGLRRPRFCHVNLPLVLGGTLVGLLIFIALFAPMLAPHDPQETFFMMQDRSGELKLAPFEPGQIPGFPLGSDVDGRDILSRLIWAVRPTLILATLVTTNRLAVGTVLGFVQGWYGGAVGDVIASVTRVALGIPILILAIIVIYILGFRFEAWIFIVALTLTGWANTTKIMSERSRVIRGEPFIEASRAIGARDRRLLWRHVLPQVQTLLLVTWAFEMSAVLLQLAELGFLGFFMGGGAIRLIPDPESGGFISELIAGKPELGQMLSAGWENFFNVPWMSVLAGTVFFLAVFSFMMLSEGLKEYFVEMKRL